MAQMASEGILVGYSKVADGFIARMFDESHLDMVVDILRRKHKVEVNIGAPQVAYREALASKVEVDHTHKRQTGATGQFAGVKLGLEPNEEGAGNEFRIEVVGGVIPTEYIPGVDKGVQSVWDSGVLLGFPFLDTLVTLLDGAYHEVGSSVVAFETAARVAMREGAIRAGVKIVEPIMDVGVVTPDEFVGNVIGDLNTRRGHIHSQETGDNVVVLRANVPLAQMLGYKRDLSAVTKGLGTFAMRFSHYAEAPEQGGPDDFRPAVGMRV
jgi:elongation factor G